MVGASSAFYGLEFMHGSRRAVAARMGVVGLPYIM